VAAGQAGPGDPAARLRLGRGVHRTQPRREARAGRPLQGRLRRPRAG